jgi:hypothetical protein
MRRGTGLYPPAGTFFIRDGRLTKKNPLAGCFLSAAARVTIMFFANSRNWLTHILRRQRTHTKNQRRSVKPQLLLLEDRLAPALSATLTVVVDPANAHNPPAATALAKRAFVQQNFWSSLPII